MIHYQGEMKVPRFAGYFLLVAVFSGCATLVQTTSTTPLANDDCGPNPRDPQKIAADWANAHYHFLPAHPFTPSDMKITGPSKVALKMPLLLPIGHKIGWQIVLGPENQRLADANELPYTLLVIYRDKVIFAEARSSPF
jgi:hypothetical protein